jgi:flagellum-specific peptidoglycan hydrolase FlgJ
MEYLTYKPITSVDNTELPDFFNNWPEVDLDVPDYSTRKWPVIEESETTIAEESKPEETKEVKPILEKPKIDLPSTTTETTSTTTTTTSNKLKGKKLTKEEFKRRHWDRAVRAAQRLNIDPNDILGQAYLETGGNDSKPMFGIKATNWSGKSYAAPTHEYINGKRVDITDNFRAYDNHDAEFDDYVKLIQGKRYQHAQGLDTARYFDAIRRAGYATAPHYATASTKLSNEFKNIKI